MPHIHLSAIPPLAAVGILSCLALAAAVLCAVALFVLPRQHRRALPQPESPHAAHGLKLESTVEDVSRRVASLAAEWHDLEEQLGNARASAPGPKVGINVTKRAQALRMHRRGDPPEQIAALLNVPFQEVDLLLKVHRMVLKNL